MALSRNQSIDQVAPYAALVQLGVDGAAAVIYEGAMVCALTATGYAVKAGVASTGAVLGVAKHRVDNSGGSDGDLSVDLLQGLFWRKNSSGNAVTQAYYGKVVYAEDDEIVCTDSGQPVAGVCLGVDSTQGVLVLINSGLNYLLSQTTLESDLASVANGEGASKIGVEDAAANFTGADVEAVLAEIMTLFAGVTGTTGGNLVGFDDSGGATTSATVADALDEMLVDMTSAQSMIVIPMGANWFEVDGTALAAFADGVSTTPGLALDNSEAAGIRWNNDAAPDPICTVVPMPQDLDDSADMVVHYLASKSGNTLGDAVTFTTEIFFQTVGALHDADADAGGASSAMTGDAAAKTVQEETLTIGNADIPASPSCMTITVQPTDGLLGTDDVTIHAMWIEYTRKLLTS